MHIAEAKYLRSDPILPHEFVLTGRIEALVVSTDRLDDRAVAAVFHPLVYVGHSVIHFAPAGTPSGRCSSTMAITGTGMNSAIERSMPPTLMSNDE